MGHFQRSRLSEMTACLAAINGEFLCAGGMQLGTIKPHFIGHGRMPVCDFALAATSRIVDQADRPTVIRIDSRGPRSLQASDRLYTS